MAKNSVPRLITDWEKFLSAFKEHEAEIPHLGPYQAALEEALEEVRVAKARQIDLMAKRRQATKDLHAAMKEGRNLVIRLRYLVKGYFDRDDERLACFGIEPARRRGRKPPTEVRKPNGSPGYH